MFLPLKVKKLPLCDDSKIFTFYATFWNSIRTCATFVKEVFWFDAKFRKWQNDCFATKEQLNFLFYILDNISQFLTILGNVWHFCTIIVPYGRVVEKDWQYWTKFDIIQQ